LDDLAQKYSGPTTTLKQQKIFDDDPSDGEDTTQVGQSRGEYDYFGESSGGEESFADEQEDDDEIEDQTEASGEDEGDIQEGDDSEREQDVPPVVFRPNLAAMSRTQTRIDDEPLKQTLDPMAALKTAKAKDVEKGHAIQKQQVGGIMMFTYRKPAFANQNFGQKTFDELLTARITLQKAWASGSKIPVRKRKVDIVSSEMAKGYNRCSARSSS
jgi:protein AATF/BFR2